MARTELRQPGDVLRRARTVRPQPQVLSQTHPHRRQERQPYFPGRGITIPAQSGDFKAIQFHRYNQIYLIFNALKKSVNILNIPFVYRRFISLI